MQNYELMFIFGGEGGCFKLTHILEVHIVDYDIGAFLCNDELLLCPPNAHSLLHGVAFQADRVGSVVVDDISIAL